MYFRCLIVDSHIWGLPFASLLGAYVAQMGFGLPSIGGKDSMSGSFDELNVPPTLVSFAVDVASENDVVTPEFKKAGNKLVLFAIEKDEYDLPNYEQVKKLYGQIHEAVRNGQIVSSYAIGAGGFWGKGLGQSLIKFKLSYSYNDFILAIICEELGVFGVIVMMTLFGYLLYRIYKIAQNAWDIEGKVLAIGVFTQIALQLLINVMVVTSVIPTTGVTLPFFSAGGTSVVFLLAELGMVLNVDKYAKERRFFEEAERHVAQMEQRGGIGVAGWRRRLDSARTRR